MRLFLSSYRLGNDQEALRALVGVGRRAGICMNACDVFDDRLMVWPREESDLAGLGFDTVEVDLRSHFGDPSGLAEQLGVLDLLWVVGGNTFVLARAMDACGFSDVARRLIVGDSLVYAGFSAGVCVITPDLAGIELMDDADAVPAGYPTDARAVALGWIPWRVVPHWDSDHPEADSAKLAVDHLLKAELPFRTLRDGHAIVIDGTQTKLIGRS
jgi:dipeptidase E